MTNTKRTKMLCIRYKLLLIMQDRLVHRAKYLLSKTWIPGYLTSESKRRLFIKCCDQIFPLFNLTVDLFLFSISFFFFYIYHPELQESDGGANTYGKQLLPICFRRCQDIAVSLYLVKI